MDTVKITGVAPIATITVQCAVNKDSAILTAPAGLTSYLWSSGATTQKMTAKAYGPYSVTLTNAARCKSTTVDTIAPSCVSTIPDSLLTGTIAQRSGCSGTNITVNYSTAKTFPNGTIITAQLSNTSGKFTAPVSIGTATIGGGFGGFGGGGGGTTRGTITATIPVKIAIGSYLVRVVATNTNSPVYIGTVSIDTVKVAALAPLFDIIAKCASNRDSAILAADPSGYVSYKWSNGSTTDSTIARTYGPYSVTVTDLAGCTNTVVDTIGSSCVAKAPDSLFTNNIVQKSTCAGTSITVNYSTIKTFPNGTMIVAQLSRITSKNFSSPVSIGTTTIAAAGGGLGGLFGGLFGGLGGGTTRGTITATLPDTLSLGSYLVRVITVSPADTGTISVDTVKVTAYPTTLTIQHFCTVNKDSAFLKAVPAVADSTFKYKWSNGVTTQIDTVLTYGTFSVTATNSIGCVVTDNITIDKSCVSKAPDTLITGTFTPKNISCSGTTISINFTSIITFPSGTQFVAQLSNASGSFSAPVTIGTSTIGTGGGGGGLFGGFFGGGGGTGSPITATLPTNLVPGASYLVRVIAKTKPAIIGTISADTVRITYNPLPASVRQTCSGNTVVLTANTSPSYTWSNRSTTQSIKTTTVGNYSVTTTDINGCNSTATYSVVATTCNSKGTAIITDSVTQLSFCDGGTVVVKFTTEGIFPIGTAFVAQLSDNLGNFTTPVNIGTTKLSGFGGLFGGANSIIGTLPANAAFGLAYRVRVISTNPADTGSSSLNTIIITSIPQANKITVTCKGDSATLSANASSSYKWSNGSTTQSIKVSQNTNPTDYSVTTSTILGCTVTMKDTIPKPSAITMTCQSDSAILTAKTNAAYLWSPSGNTTKSIMVREGVYKLTTSDSAGCKSTAVYTVDTTACFVSKGVIVPNFFTPNGDGVNDEYMIHDPQNTIHTVTIFNRWGDIVFKTSNLSTYWNGGVNNSSDHPSSPGTYYYVLELNNNAQSNLKTKGFIQLIR